MPPTQGLRNVREGVRFLVPASGHQWIICESFQSMVASSRLEVDAPERQRLWLMPSVNQRDVYITTHIKDT